MSNLEKGTIIDALTSSENWNGSTLGQPLSISFSFISFLPDYYNLAAITASLDVSAKEFMNNMVDETNPANFDAFTENQQLATYKAMLAWQSVANITFNNAGNDNTNAVITLGSANFITDNYGITVDRGSSLSQGQNHYYGDIWLNMSGAKGAVNLNEINPGQDGYETILHELGHALGLDHPFGGINSLPAGVEDQLHTTMSYTKANITYNGAQWYPSAPMLYDILAIQTLYGPNLQYHQFDDPYVFSSDSESPDVMAIWDAGGTDAFNASNQTKRVFINLNPGEFSSIGTGDPNKAYIAIAYQVAGQANNWIENAYGGSGKDQLIGNDTDNLLAGGKGNDHLEGGVGDDTYIYTQGDGIDTILDHSGNDQIIIDGAAVSGEFKPPVGGGHIYYSADKTYEFRLMVDEIWRVSVRNAGTGEYKAVADIDHWHSGEFGITTSDVAATVDRVSLSFPNSMAYLNMNGGAATRGVQFDGGTKSDSFSGSNYNDKIDTGDGLSNYILSTYGGDDWVKGGDSRDFIRTGANGSSTTISDNDLAFGGAQSDVLLGGYGSDQLWGDADDDAWLVAGADSTERGDWLSGENGNDSLYGSRSSDVVFGGAGEDLLRGGAPVTTCC